MGGVLASLARIDRATLRGARRATGAVPGAGRALATFSRLGEHGAVWLAIGSAGALARPARRREWLTATATVFGVYVLNTAVKFSVRRRRPIEADLPALVDTPTQLSFPSAHAATGFAGARLYSRLGLPRGPLNALAGALALSRVALGVHYPSDVLAGAALGRLLAAARR